MQRFGLILGLGCLLGTCVWVEETCAADLPAQVKVGSNVLALNGTGIRKKSFLSLYTAGLYLKEKSTSATGIIRANEPMSIRIQITSKFVSRDNLTSALKEGFQNATNGRTESIKEDIQSFTRCLSDDIEMGDVFDLVYIPETGVIVLKNGKRMGTVGDLAFKQALFGIWLSNRPADTNLKKGLLGA